MYKTAFFLSLAIHIFCVTGAEAALILSKKINPQPVFIFMTSPASESKPALNSEKTGTAMIQKTHSLVQPEPKTKSQKPAKLKSVQKFKKKQNQLNHRISSIQKEIIKKQVQLLQSVSSSVYEVEKIPIEMRASILPDYLQEMRSEISAHWLLLLSSVQCESCTAIVEYRIDPKGKIFDLKSLKPSGHPAFDSACMNAVLQSNPLPALPFHFDQEIKEEYLTVSLTFYFEKDKPTQT